MKKCFLWHGIKENNKIQLFSFHNFCQKHTSACLLPRIVRYVDSPKGRSTPPSPLYDTVFEMFQKADAVSLSAAASPSYVVWHIKILVLEPLSRLVGSPAASQDAVTKLHFADMAENLHIFTQRRSNQIWLFFRLFSCQTFANT